MITTPTIKFQKLHEDAAMPFRATADSAGYDLSTVDEGTLAPGGSHTLSTGLAVAIPDGYVGLIFSRSGMGFRNGIRLANCVAVIDSDYRGPVLVRLTNDSEEEYDIAKGSKIAQLVLLHWGNFNTEWVDSLEPTLRSDGGFGSTG